MKSRQEFQAGNGTEVNSVLRPTPPFEFTLWLSFKEVLTDFFFHPQPKKWTKLNLIFTECLKRDQVRILPLKITSHILFSTISLINFDPQIVPSKYGRKIKTVFSTYGNGLIFPDNHWSLCIKQFLYIFTKEYSNCNPLPWRKFPPSHPVEIPQFTKTILNKKISF